VPAPASTITALTLIADVRRQFGDADAIQISDLDILAWLNQGVRELISNFPINQATAVTSTAVGTYIYSLPSDMYEMRGVQYDTAILGSVGFDEALTRYGPSLTDRGIPEVWWTYGNNLYVYPVPNYVLPLTIYYIKAPSLVSVSSSLLPVPDRYYNNLLQFVLARAYEMDEQADMQNAQETLFQRSTMNLKNADSASGGVPVMVDRAYEGVDDYYGW
jgi:hypothetical protein